MEKGTEKENASVEECVATEEDSKNSVQVCEGLPIDKGDSSVTDSVAEHIKEENGVQPLKEEPASDIPEIPSKSVDLTVFVGKLCDRVTPEELKKFFTKETKSEESEVVGVNMPWKVVKKSKKLGIAFVDFSNQRAYQVALTLNNVVLFGQNIIVLPATHTHQGLLLMDGPEGEAKDAADTDSVKSKNAASYVPVYKKSDHVAYIKNLPHGVTEDEVLEFFKFTRQDIVDIAIPIPFKAKRNAKRPVRAIIAFPSEESLDKCLAQTKTMYRDREVVVERHQMVSKVVVGEKRSASDTKDASETASPEKQPRTANTEPTGQVELDLFVKHIPREASDRQIKDFFGSAGATVLKVNLFSESITGSTRGMGFVTMADKESVQKGLQLDCKRFYKNKVRVSIRRDREHLDRPGEVEPNYSTFVGNLPIKEKAETLKQAIFKHFKDAECAVKNVYIPLAPNRSGNRGYAFISFENEASLKKGQGLNNSELKYPNNKVNIVVSDRWPENPSDVGGDKGKERGAPNSLQEPPGSGKQRKRKKGFPTPGILQGPPGLPGLQVPMENMGPQQNRWNCPPDYQPDGPEFGPYGSDYQDYLDYLEYRDYMAMRKAYDERRELAEFRARYRAEREEEFIQQQQQPQQQQPMPPPLVPPPQPTPATQGPIGTVFSRPVGGVRKDGRLDDNYRNSSFASSGRRDRGSYEDHPPGSGSSSRSREFHEFEFIGSRGGAGDAGLFSNSGSGAGGFGSGGGGGGSGGGGSVGGGSVGGGGNSSFMGSDQRGSGGYNFSDSFSSSLNSSRYQTPDSSFSRSRLLDNSNMGSSTMGFSRNSSIAFRDSANGIDTSNRGGGGSNYNSGYPTGGGGSGVDARSHSSLSGGNGSSNLRSSAHDTGRPQYGLMSYSGHDRATSSFSGGMAENSGFAGTSTGGSYSGGEGSQRYSYSSNASLQGERHRYSGYPMSSAEPHDQFRKSSQYDKSESSVARLGSTGMMTNSGYDGYPGLSGYRAG